MTNEVKKQLKHQLDCRLIAFGMLGKFNKPMYTKKGNFTKGRKFLRHPLQVEATEKLVSLLNNDISAGEVHTFLHATSADFIRAKNINIEAYKREVSRY